MSSEEPQLFALIPAAGQSRRMRQPKLLLPFGDTTVIGRLLTTLADAGIETFVLIRPGDDALRDDIARTPARIVQSAEPPPEMRVSVELLLRTVKETRDPSPRDGWLLIPADHPLLTTQTLQQLINTWQPHDAGIILPTCNGRRGHPTLFSWTYAEGVFQLPPNVGVNHLVRSRDESVIEVPVDDPCITLDLDTPEDYARALTLIPDD